MQDRYLKIMLTIVAVLLAINVVQSVFTNPTSSADVFLGSAHAQSRNSNYKRPTGFDVKALKGYNVDDLRAVVPLGDGISFIATRPNGFMVYQVLPKQ